MEPFKVRLTGSGSGTLDAVKVTAELIHFVGEPEPAPTEPPAAPQNAEAVAGDGEVSLSWTPSPGAEGHRIYRSETDDFDTATQVGSDLGGFTNTYVDDTAVNGTVYYYWIVSFNDQGESDPAPTGEVTPTQALSLSDLDDVDTAGVQDGDWLTYNAGDDAWEPGAPT